ncbi:MAG: YraN family protein [Rikenellaceae bacterium]
MLTDRAQIGKLGEMAATKWLREQGYMIRDLNWRAGRYELDIVAQRWGMIHFVEVKCRKADGLTTPESAMTRNKIESIKRAAISYLAKYQITDEFQFDLIAVDFYPDSSMEVRLIERVI